MEQTKVTEENREDFFRKAYLVQTFSKSDLFSIEKYNQYPIVAIDSCGWHYESLFPDIKIIKIESIETVKEFNLDKTQFDKLFNNVSLIKFPDECVLLLDHCPRIFKYRTENEMKGILKNLLESTNAKFCLARFVTATLGDNRLTDRFSNLIQIIPENYIVSSFVFNSRTFSFEIKRKETNASTN